MPTAFDQLKQSFEDATTITSDLESAIKSVQETVSDIRKRCPGLQLECVFNGFPVGGGAYEGAQAERSAAELVAMLSDSERIALQSFVEKKLLDAEKSLDWAER